jgi:formate dehydrogenase major subunit
MGHADAFRFSSAEDVWNEIRSVWPAGAGITYGRLEHGGLQWPCPDERHPGTEVLHERRFSSGERAHLALVPFSPTAERTDDEYPFLLTTGRTLHQYNAGTMTLRTRNTELRAGDFLDVSPEDAARLGITQGQEVVVRSRYGSAALRVAVTSAMRPGELFATFHTASVFLNRVTSPSRDRRVDTPEYKVTAVRLEFS